MDYKNQLEWAKEKAKFHRVNIEKVDDLLRKIEEDEQYFNPNFSIYEKYEAMLFWGTTGLFEAEEIAEEFNHNPNNLHSDFNKNIGRYIKSQLELDDHVRVGITSIRRIFRAKGYLIDLSGDNDNTTLDNLLPSDLWSELSDDGNEENENDDEQNT